MANIKKKTAVDWLKSQFEKINASGSKRISQREFARILSLSPGMLSEILSGQRTMSREVGKRIASRLNLETEARTQFLRYVEAEWLEKSKRQLKTRSAVSQKSYRHVSADEFTAMSHWYSTAIICYLNTEHSDKSIGGIARALSLDLKTAEAALVRLLALSLVKEKQGQWFSTDLNIMIPCEVRNAVIANYQKECMKQALDALERVPVQNRDITSICMAADPKKLAAAKEMIAKFQRRLAAFLEEGERSEVILLNTQLVPLTGAHQAEQ